ncbi:hypothetical protein SEVIR_9G159100v4 [Setaria viridis]|uniref:Uncharacterized protein n=1 Tax=Setaria viridis TaxID=4556 RepID=A0A4U6SY18_SETVI|nr:uncharacterized protein LOC117840120 [Setaria viridis]TKV92362.1 hypothetical protein SEVIR_9G159100v2 [Setaria viridis]
MDHRAFVRPIAVATALQLLAALHGAGPCVTTARPLVGRLPAAASRSRATTTSALAVAPAAAAQYQRGAAAGGDEDAAAREGKWLPFAGAHHLPAAYWAHKPVPWAGVAVGASPELGAAGAVEGGGGEKVVRDRDHRRRHGRESYVGDDVTTRQEQLAMWASLLNPKGRGTPATGWLPAPGIGEAADDEPAKAADTVPVEGAEGDEPSASAGQTYWGNNGN